MQRRPYAMKILFQGDSITDCGRNTSNGSQLSIGQGYALIVASHLGFASPGKYEFINAGVSGNRITDMYARMKSDCWNHEPDVLSILIGVNDVWHEVGAKNGVDEERFENVYRMLLSDTLKRLPNIKILMLEPFLLKCGATVEAWDYFSSEVSKRARIAERLAEEFSQVFVPLQKSFDDACSLCPAEYWISDGVHPTPYGHQLIANRWLEAFNAIDF